MADERAGRRLPIAVAAVAGLVVGAGGALAIGGATGGDGTATALTLPDTLGDMRPVADVVAELGSGAEVAADRGKVLDELAEKLSAAHDGAGVASAAYADDDLDVQVSLFAVAAPSPALWSTQDAETLAEQMGLARPVEWVERDGDAECLVRQHANLSRAGTDPADVEFHVVRCQLVATDLTVLLEGSSALTLDQGFALVREAADGVQRA